MFIEAKDDGGGGDNLTTGAISCGKLQSNRHHQQTNLLTPSSPGAGGLPTLSLTTISSLGRVAMPISPVMPVPNKSTVCAAVINLH